MFSYQLEVLEAFALSREGEEELYQEFKKVRNISLISNYLFYH